jgi:hypothetical protein
LQAQADQYGYPQSIIGHPNLTEPAVEETLPRQCAYANVGDIRMPLQRVHIICLGWDTESHVLLVTVPSVHDWRRRVIS